MTEKIIVLGAGLAGSEAAYQIARLGLPVRLFEMKPGKKSPAHHADTFAELVCSNSMRSADVTSAAGLLKEEMRLLGSLVMAAADAAAVPAGGALAVDRTAFSEYITARLRENPLIEIVQAEADDIPPDRLTVVATGPLTEGKIARSIERLTGRDTLSFFDAAAPIVSAESVDGTHTFPGDRYGDGAGDYLNCPLTQEEYGAFYETLLAAETARLKDFENDSVFEGCMPVEVMAARGRDTLRFGPMKPVGLRDPKTGMRPYAVVQLRSENRARTMFNLVGFQTHLTFPEQRRVFGMIPALHSAEFLRYGVMHRNTFLNSPGLLDRHYRLIKTPNVFFAGQMTGVEGYVESASSGLVAGLNAARQALGRPLLDFTAETATGALQAHVGASESGGFQPMNVNFGLFAELPERIRDKKAKREALAKRAVAKIKEVAAL